jgi:uncharacterized BrkB/YihY/UPF0761 family membrane protein
MVRDQASTGGNVTDRRAGRGRLFLGSVLLLGAVAACVTGLFINPIEEGTSSGLEHVRTSVVIFMRNSAIATLVLVALASLLLFPRPRLRHPLRDRLLIGVAAALAAFSIYRLIWLQTTVGG